ncbi:uncharacterized protein LOC62_01G000293 [Vanrija pseudolonga]|uniref:Uncharacterized protein n=1 Tax=Vanrija pseudolonga TaxID=143232 RepID=A0AAF0XZ41_9TREE|nr:hypothetical protein LOC62_01G000293 [Vanrija pseudolonga]
MHLTLSFTPTSLTAALWDGLESVVELSAAFRVLSSSSSSDQPLSTSAQLQALDTTLYKLAQHADLGAVSTISGTVPHPTYLALAPGFECTLARLDPTLPLGAQQLPDMPIADLFTGTIATPIASPGAQPDPAPLGRFLTSLLLQRSGAATAQERSLSASFASAEIRSKVAGAAEALGPVGTYWRERYGLARARVLPCDLVVIHTRDIDYAALCTDADAGLPELVGPGAVAVLADANAPAARLAVRDKYANAKWDVLAHLAGILPPGGGVGHDDKCFAFVRPYPARCGAYPGTTRFEHGAVVSEFRDLRANSRCVLESHVLQLARDVAPFGTVSRVVLVSRDLE